MTPDPIIYLVLLPIVLINFINEAKGYVKIYFTKMKEFERIRSEKEELLNLELRINNLIKVINNLESIGYLAKNVGVKDRLKSLSVKMNISSENLLKGILNKFIKLRELYKRACSLRYELKCDNFKKEMAKLKKKNMRGKVNKVQEEINKLKSKISEDFDFLELS